MTMTDRLAILKAVERRNAERIRAHIESMANAK